MVPQTFIFIGRSGCGKGTQSELLHKYLDEHDKEEHLIFYLETGARFRAFIEQDNFTSKLSKKVSERGDRQPDFLAVWMWSNIVVENFTNNEHLIIDGTPRSVAEAKVLDSALKFYDRATSVVVYLNVSHDWSLSHLERRGRADDIDPKEIEKRLAWFEKDVVPALEYLRTNPDYKFVEVNGEQGKEKVHYDIIEKVFGDSPKI
jgi:adenylate kinase